MTGPIAESASSGDLPLVLHLGDPGENGYHEHLRVPALSAGRFTAAPGYNDQQSPHIEDEIYYVLAGRAVLQIDGTSHPVTPGSLAYVPRGVEHRFPDISTNLDVLVVFIPAEGTPPY